MIDMGQMGRRMRQAQRATVARSALDVIALIFLGCGFAFWGVAFWQLLAPPALLSPLTIQVMVLALVYSLAAPLLWSALVPSTPAGQLLQKTQWRTFGFAAIVCAAFYLTYQAEGMLELWLWHQPGVQEAGWARSLAISLSIGFILIPALAWTQLTPERWMQQIQQAHAVKKLEMQQRGELAIIKASLVRAETLAAIGWANLLPVEREEVAATLRGLLMASSDTMRSVVRTLNLSSDLERSIMNDNEIADQLDYVTQAIDVVPAIDAIEVQSEPRAMMRAPDRALGPSERAETAPAAYTESHKDRVSARVPGTQGNARGDGDYTIAYEAFGLDEAWTVRDLAGVLKVAESTARKTKIAWENDHLISGQGLSNGRYRFV